MTFPVEDILTLLPQRPPFVMVSKLLRADENTATSSFVIKAGNVLVKNGFLQEAGLIENMAQTAALRAGYMAQTENTAVINGYIGAVKDLVVHSLPRVNDELETTVTMENQVFNVSVFSGKIWCSGVLLAQCEMKVFMEV